MAGHTVCSGISVYYNFPMTKLLQHAFDLAKSLPDNRQDELGEMLLMAIEQAHSPLALSVEQFAEVRRRKSHPGPLATEGETEAFFEKLAG